MDNATFQKIKDLLMANQSVGIVVGPNPTLDQMAAGLGMYLVAKQMGKATSIVCPTDPTVSISSLVGIDKVQKALGGTGGDLTVAFPYKEGEIEKVSYTLDNWQLNIVVKAGAQGLSFDEGQVQYKHSGGFPTLLIVIGVQSLSQINSLLSPEQLTGLSVVNIDNKENNEKFGDVQVVGTKFSSNSEQVADFLTLLEPQIELDVDTSQNLLSGILSATNDFQSPKTSYLAFEMAGILMKKGASRSGVPAPRGTEKPGQRAFFPPIPQQPFVQAQPQQFVPQPQPQAGGPLDQMPQPMQQTQPVQIPVQQPIQQNAQPQSNGQAPADWLTPKVYKGSTIL